MKVKQLLLIFCLFSISISGQIAFQEYLVTNDADYAIDVFTADIDGDGDLDLITASRNNGGKVSWFENSDGLGNFENESIILTGMLTIRSVLAFDVDNDGDNDVVVGISGTSSVSGDFYLYKNDDGLGTFTNEGIIATSSSVLDVKAADLDNDNDLDLVAPTAWFENIGASGVFDNPRGFPTLGVSHSSKAVFVADLDGDNNLDVMTVRSDAGTGRALYFKNDNGLGVFNSTNSYILFGQYGGASDIAAGDFDNDGDNDVLISSTNNFSSASIIAILENIDASVNDFESITVQLGTQTRSIAFGDIDTDGDLDVVGAYNSRLVWFENMLTTNTFGEAQIINPVAYNTMQTVCLSDIDNDNDLDIISPTSGDDSVRLYENMGVLGNEISGTIRLNLDLTNCFNFYEGVPNLLVSVSDNASNTFSTFTTLSGAYQVPVNVSEFEITPIIPFEYYQPNPLSRFVEFVDLGNTFTADFCVEPVGDINDLQVSIYPLRPVVPGFDTFYQIVYKNTGTTQLNGTVDFEFDGTKINFLNASETVSSQTGNSLSFDFMDLNPFETRTINLEFNVFPPPTTEIDDILIATATINPVSGDETEEDNVFELEQTVIGSYDPNDIACLEGGQILIEDIDKYLHYLIRFQNTGTASATKVVVENVLDDKLDWTTMQLESLSHYGRVEIKNGSEVSFIFSNINLPDSTSDEPNSHGFIAYKIKPNDNVVLGDVFNATADIFFDFNPAIVTNTASTEVVESLSVGEFGTKDVRIYPNPTNKLLNFEGIIQMKSIAIIDINGRLLQNIYFDSAKSSYQLDVSNLSSGVYFVRINSQEGIQVKKLIKR